MSMHAKTAADAMRNSAGLGHRFLIVKRTDEGYRLLAECDSIAGAEHVLKEGVKRGDHIELYMRRTGNSKLFDRQITMESKWRGELAVAATKADAC